jgi:hypothetical protein
VHGEALMTARVEGIWRRRCGPEVDGASSGLENVRWTGAQLLVVVTGPGSHWSGPATERHPQQRKRMASATSILGGQWSWLGDGARGHAEEEARHKAAAHD